jgi:hypothetical protein
MKNAIKLVLLFILLHNHEAMSQHRFMKFYDNNVKNKIADLALDIIELPDSGYLIPVVSNVIFEADTFGFAKTYLQILRVDKNGDTIYQRNYFKKGFSISTWCIVKTNDDNYLIAGHIYDLVKYHNDTIGSKILLVKINSYGDTLWSKTLDIGDGDEFAKKLINTNDGGYAIMGQVCNKQETNCDMYLMKLDSNANLEWHKTYTWDENYWENPTSFIQTNTDEFVLTSAVRLRFTEIISPYIVKTDVNGNKLWHKKLDNEGNNYAYFENVAQVKEDSLIFVGTIGDNRPQFSITKGWIIQTDTAGNFFKNIKIGDENKYTYFRHIVVNNNQIIIQGATNNYNVNNLSGRTCLYAFNLNFEKQWRRVYQDSILPNQVYVTYNMKATNDGGYAMIGFGRDPNAAVPSQDVWLIKVDSMGCLADNCISLGYAEELGMPNYFYAYPNPTNRYLSLNTNLTIQKVEVFDMLGSKVWSQPYTSNSTIDLESLSDGLYLLKLEDIHGKLFTEKVLIEK